MAVPAPVALFAGQFPVLLFTVGLTASPSSFRGPGAVQRTHPAHTAESIRLAAFSGVADLVFPQVRYTHTHKHCESKTVSVMLTSPASF